MAILKSEILEVVNDNLERAETNIDVQLRQALKYISGEGNYLTATDATQTITTGLNVINYPTDYKDLLYITLNNGTYDYEPLERISYDVYKKYMAGSQSYSLPKYYTEFSNTFLVYPKANLSYKVTIDYFRIHPSAVTTILFDEKFRTAIEAFTSLNVAKKFGITEAINLWGSVASDEVNKLTKYSINKPTACKYTD